MRWERSAFLWVFLPHIHCHIMASVSPSGLRALQLFLLGALSSLIFLHLCSVQPGHPTQLVQPNISVAPSSSSSSPILQPRNDGVLFVSNAAYGQARNLVYELASHGYHILVGVRNKRERNSFSYAMRKGVELIDFDMGDPATYVDLVYRLRKIRRDLDRPFAGMVVNLNGITYPDTHTICMLIGLFFFCRGNCSWKMSKGRVVGCKSIG
jgi:hypothetical protein